MTEFKTLSKTEIDELIERVERAIAEDLALSKADRQLLLGVLLMVTERQISLSLKDVTIHKWRKLAGIISSSEKRSAVIPDGDASNDSDGTQKSDAATSKPDGNSESTASGKPKKKPSTQKAERVIRLQCHHNHDELKAGQLCPECGHGRLYLYQPVIRVRIQGEPPLSAVEHIFERLRCNSCGAYFTATPTDDFQQDGGMNQLYGYSARAIIALHRHFAGLPLHRQQTLQQILGVPLTASSLYDQTESVANDGFVVFKALKQLAADAPHFNLDDTPNRILNQGTILKPDRRSGQLKSRSGTFTSGVIATLESGQQIVLYQTDIGHAGELIDEILRLRHPGLPKPTIMCDALSRNLPTVLDETQRHDTFCNSHCRRGFVDVAELHPDKVPWVLALYDPVWHHDAHCKEEKYTPAERLAYHQQHSLPLMAQLKQWGEAQIESGDVEENSPLGKAIRYLLNHYDKLTGFCRIEGAQIDNNQMERMLKLVIRGRRNSLFFRTLGGAGVADVILSLVATCYLAGVNPFDYLVALQRYVHQVNRHPQLWFPWNYQQTLASLSVPLKAAA